MRGRVNISENLQPAPAEVLDEFARIRVQLQSEFEPANLISQDVIDEYFENLGLETFPTILIPNTLDGYAKVRRIVEESKYPDSFVHSIFSEETDFDNPFRPGWALSASTYQLNIATDLGGLISDGWGDDVSWQSLHMTLAHEEAHSIFFRQSTFHTSQLHGEVKGIYETSILSGGIQQLFGVSDYTYTPSWIDEAISTYVAADCFRTNVERSRPFHKFFNWEDVRYKLEEPYTVHSSRYPNYPGFIGGAISGQTLENLDKKFPGTVKDLLGIAQAVVDPDEYRSNMAARVGPELFRLMFTPQPYDTWPRIYKMVQELDV